MKIYIGWPGPCVPNEWGKTFGIASFRFLSWLFPGSNEIKEIPSILDSNGGFEWDKPLPPNLDNLYWRDIRRCGATPSDLVVVVSDFSCQGCRYEFIQEGEDFSDPAIAVPVMAVTIMEHGWREDVPSWALLGGTVIGARSEKYIYADAQDAEAAALAVRRRALELGLDWREAI